MRTRSQDAAQPRTRQNLARRTVLKAKSKHTTKKSRSSPPQKPIIEGHHFKAPHPPPSLLFKAASPPSSNQATHRFIRKDNSTEGLIFTAGWCIEAGAPAGCAFVYRPAAQLYLHSSSKHRPTSRLGFERFRLEKTGPSGQETSPSMERAELRAAIAALQFRNWSREGFKRIIIASDSYYLVGGATEWVKKWEKNGWQTSHQQNVTNQDLWQTLREEMRKWEEKGMQVLFWHISRKQNYQANHLAKDGVNQPQQESFTKIVSPAIRHSADLLPINSSQTNTTPTKHITLWDRISRLVGKLSS